MWDILPGTLYHWYRNHLSDYHPDRESGVWPQNAVIRVDEDSGEVLEENVSVLLYHYVCPAKYRRVVFSE